MSERTPLSDGDKQLINDIAEYGHHVIRVLEDETGPAFTYSVGLYKSYGHPEILIIGLKQELSHFIINDIGDRIKNSETFEPGKYYSGLINGFDCFFINVKKTFYKEYVGYCLWYYQNDDFPLMQCIYPTVKGIYPWQSEWPESIKDLQPILGDLK